MEEQDNTIRPLVNQSVEDNTARRLVNQSSAEEDTARRLGGQSAAVSARSASYGSTSTARQRSDDSWVAISSQPSSSSLSSVNDDIITTGLRVRHDPRPRRRRTLRPTSRPPSAGGTSSQEEYEESESESDRVMTSSNEGPPHFTLQPFSPAPLPGAATADGHDEGDADSYRTAINPPTTNEQCFTPQPNAFSRPPSSSTQRHASQPVPGSYFPPLPISRPTSRAAGPPSHSPFSHTHTAAAAAATASHDATLRASLNTLLSCARARKTPALAAAPAQHSRHSTRIDPSSLRLVAAAPSPSPRFHPTLRRASPTSDDSASSSASPGAEQKRKAPPPTTTTTTATATAGGSVSKERRAFKKPRRASASPQGAEAHGVAPTLLTWVVSAGVVVVVVVVLGALSFGAGYEAGWEAGRQQGRVGVQREAGGSARGLRRAVVGGAGVRA